jgi:hypothetical protein
VGGWRRPSSIAGLAKRQEAAIRVGHAALNFGNLLVRECHIVIVAGAVLNDGACGGGLHILGQFPKHADRIIQEFSHDAQHTKE